MVFRETKADPDSPQAVLPVVVPAPPPPRPRKRRPRSLNLLPSATSFATILGAAIAASTAINGYYAKQRELEVADKKVQLDITTAYLDRAIDPARPLDVRQQVLRFLQKPEGGDSLREWAREEEQRVSEIAQLKQAADDAAIAEKKAHLELEELALRVEEAEKKASPVPVADKVALKKSYEAATAQVKVKREEAVMAHSHFAAQAPSLAANELTKQAVVAVDWRSNCLPGSLLAGLKPQLLGDRRLQCLINDVASVGEDTEVTASAAAKAAGTDRTVRRAYQVKTVSGAVMACSCELLPTAQGL